MLIALALGMLARSALLLSGLLVYRIQSAEVRRGSSRASARSFERGGQLAGVGTVLGSCTPIMFGT
jgi:hypothetical protein